MTLKLVERNIAQVRFVVFIIFYLFVCFSSSYKWNYQEIWFVRKHAVFAKYMWPSLQHVLYLECFLQGIASCFKKVFNFLMFLSFNTKVWNSKHLKISENIYLIVKLVETEKKQLNLGVNELQLLQNFTGKYSKLSFIVIVGCYYAKSSLNHIWKTKTKDFMTKDNSIFLTQYSLTKFFFVPLLKL